MLWTAAAILRTLLRLLGGSCRPRMVSGDGRLEEIAAGGGPVIFAFWHNRAFYFAHLLRRRFLARGFPIAMLASRSRDGELGAKLGRMLGTVVYRGSASRGGTEGLRRLYRALAGGTSCVILPDGPHGPVYEVKRGAVVLAQMTGVPIVPMAWSAERAWALSSWDRLLIPKPFSRVAVAVGESYTVPRQLTEEGLDAEARKLEEALRRLSEEVEREARSRMTARADKAGS